MDEYAKWNQYVVGQTAFINRTQEHPHRKLFTDFVINSCNSVVEIGPGEMIEYETVRDIKKVDYTIVDVSDVFIANCQEKYPEVRTVKRPMEQVDRDAIGGKKDVVYAASVIEHSKDPRLAIKSILSLADHFHIVLFKWSYSGSLKAVYHESKKYWSTCFNIHQLLDVIRSHGHIEYCDLITKSSGQRIPFRKYQPKKARATHRTGNYLVIHGRSNG